MIFPRMGLENPKGEISFCHGGTETQSGNGLFLSFSVPLCLCGDHFFAFSLHGIASAYHEPQNVL